MRKLPRYMLAIILIFSITLTACAIPNFIISNQMLTRGNELFDEGKYEEAAELYEKALKAYKYNATAYGNKAAALIILEKYDEALELANKALEINHREATFHLNKGEALNNLGENEKAIESFDKAIEADPKLTDAYNSKGVAYYYMDKYEESLKEFDKAVKLDSGYFDAYFWKAQVYINQGKYEDALDACDRGISRSKKDPEGYSKRAEILIEMNRYEEALANLNKGIALDKDFVDTYIDKMDMYYNLKDYEACIDFGLDSLKRFPSDENINWFIADSYSAILAHDNAVKYYIKALEINPQNNQVAVSVGWEYFYMQDYVNAQKFTEKAKELSGDSYEIESLQEELDKTKLPEAERIVDFVKSNYLYMNENKNFNDISEEFIKDKNLTAAEIQDYIDSIRIKNDIFTFVVSGEDYDYMTREEITNQVSYYELEKNTFYIKINSFVPSTGSDFRKALKEIKNTKDTNLVIDLRGNSGGLIYSSTDILDYLLPECTTSYVIDRNGYIDSYYSNENQISFRSILILVDENSASSAELLTLGLKKYLNNVVVIGKPTFGKGVGQNIYEDKNKKYMIFLVSFYWNVKEENISGSRIYPDVKINSNSNEDYIRAIKAQIK